MAMDAGLRPPSSSKNTSGTSDEKPLKRRKSLSRSISSAFRKSPRSRPTSPTTEDVLVPPTPQVPLDLRPSSSSHQSSSRSLISTPPTTPAVDDEEAVDLSQGSIGLGIDTLEPKEDSTQVKKKKSMRYLSLRHSRQKSWNTGDDLPKPRLNVGDRSVSDSPKSDKTTSRPKASTSRSILRIDPSVTSPLSSAPTSAISSKQKSSPALPQVSRPVTAGGSPRSPPLTSFARPRGNSSPHAGILKSGPDLYDLPPSPQRPWQASSSPTDARNSFRSALTTTSSRAATTATNRSSVVTKDTIITEPTLDPLSRPMSKSEEGMTVDEAIDMYVAGFTDDPPEGEDSRDTSLSDEERRRSIKIAEAVADNMGSPNSPRPSTAASPASARPSTSASTRSFSFKLLNSVRKPSLTKPSLPDTDPRDQYGFSKSNHYITHIAYDAWNAQYQPLQEHRAEKWKAYLREQHLPLEDPIKFPSRSLKTQRYVRKGIPPAWRGAAWFYYAGGETYLSRHPQMYNNLVLLTETKLSALEKEAIERDLHRTFPDNVKFKPHPSTSPPPETPILASLRRVLRAFALHSPKIGYCQSLNFIAALLLLFLPEEKSFWMLHIITMLYLPGTHEVSLEGANIDLWVLMVALKNTLPTIWAKVGAGGMTEDDGRKSKLPPISLCTTSWFMSLFIGTLPIETVLRVWDVLFYEGSRTLFRVAISIFRIGEQSIKKLNDSMELFQVVQGLPRGMLDASSFMEAVCGKGQVSADWVERMRGERRICFAKERAKAGSPPAPTINEVEQGQADAAPKKVVVRKKSMWRKKVKEREPLDV